MEITRLADLKPRTVWEITDDAFDLYRERISLLATVSAVVFVPFFILISAARESLLHIFQTAFNGPEQFVRLCLQLAWLIPLIYLVYFVQLAATAIAVRDSLSNVSVSVVSAYKQTFKQSFPLLLSTLIVSLIALVFCFTIIVPTSLIVYYCFTPAGIVLENRKFGDALKRSLNMAQSYSGKASGLLFLIGFIGIGLLLGVDGLVQFLFQLAPKTPGVVINPEAATLQSLTQVLCEALMAVVIAPLPAIATTLLYYDLRVRREGLDIESEAHEWGVALAPDPFGGVLNPKVPKKPKGGRK